jgi:hypothetical protein
VVSVVTHKADAGSGWAIDDPVVRLRRWGTAEVFELPAEAHEWVIGAADDCGLRLHDPTGCISRHHACLTREETAWTLRDLDSTNGVRQDGERRLAFQLAPGVEIEIGSITLLAESTRLVELHRYLQRIIGWRSERAAEVDRALRAVREAATRRAALVLCGDGDLVPIAHRLHGLAVGQDRPFVVGDSLPSAASGTLCVSIEALPPGFAAVCAALQAPEATARFVICAPTRADATDAMTFVGRSALIELPSIASRADEAEQLIVAYADDAVAMLGAPSRGFREYELHWLRQVPIASLSELEETCRRVVALRTWGVTAGAERLGITHAALSRWARRRKIPT